MIVRCSYRLAAAAGLALTAAAVAQPVATNLGTLSNGTVTVPNIPIGPGEIVWYTFTLTSPIPAGGQLYLDIDSEGSALAPSNDTELGLYDSAGALITSDDDDGSGLLSQLSYGSTIARPAVGGAAYNGRDGALAAGTYYLSVSGFNTTFGATGWNVTSTSGNTGTAVLNLALGQLVAGACCMPNFTCAVTTSDGCAAAGGVYRGDNTTCASANCPQPPAFQIVTNIPGAFTDISSTGTSITQGDDSSVAFASGVTNDLVTTASLFASTNGNITSSAFTTFGNAALPVATLNFGLFPFWDDLYVDTNQGGSLTHQTVVESGVNVEVVQWNNVRTFSGGTGSATGTFEVKIFENGAGPGGARAQFIYQSVGYAGATGGHEYGASATIGYQQSPEFYNQFSFNTPALQDGMVISIIPAGGPPATCYPNCDHSTQVPFLNVLDFNCFLNAFTNGQSYANCDNSTQVPILNVLDFNCFLNRFTAGCSAP